MLKRKYLHTIHSLFLSLLHYRYYYSSSPSHAIVSYIYNSVGFTFITKDGRKEIREAVGTNLLDAAHKNNIDLEGMEAGWRDERKR